MFDKRIISMKMMPITRISFSPQLFPSQMNEDAEMIEAILRAPSGCDLNKPEGQSFELTYPILRAIAGGRLLVERLLVAGADPAVVGGDQESSLSMASGDLYMIEMLAFYGADLNHRCENNDTVSEERD